MLITDIKDIKTQFSPELIITADGSHSLYIKDLDEPYHSFHGAIQESKHVFIEAGLKTLFLNPPLRLEKGIVPKINILEIGLGTGLNALLSILETKKLPLTINYTCIEPFPIDIELAKQLNYLELLNENGNYNSIFNNIHNCDWEKDIAISKNFNLHKIKNKLQEVSFTKTFDLVYFDAFGPPTQPEMWTEEIFQKIYTATNLKGILVTYCAKGVVKRTLKKVGFTVETLPGPARKREMLRALKSC